MPKAGPYALNRQPDFRIDADQIGVIILPGINEPISTVVHRRVGCPKVSPIQIHDGYLRCSKCYIPLTQPAQDYVTRDLDAGYDERTNSFWV